MTSETVITGQQESSSSPRLADLVQATAAARPEAAALVVTTERVPVTYRELVGLVDDLAGQLTQAGLRAGDRVALRAASNIEFVVALLAGSRADLVVVPLDPALPVGDQRARSDAAGARVVLVDGATPEDSEATALRWWPIAVSTGPDGSMSVRLEATGEPNPAPSTPEGLRQDDAMIMFTGGTTGLPKMVPWTRDNIASSVRAVIAGYRLGPQDATVAVMPLYHGHGLIAALLASLVSGGTVLVPARGRFSAHTFWDDINAVHATWYTAVPTIHQILLERAKAEQPENNSAALRFIRSCSAPLTPETAQALHDTFSATVVCAFGMTEATHQVATTGIEGIEGIEQARAKTRLSQPVSWAGQPGRRSGSPVPTACPCRPVRSGRSGCAAAPWSAVISVTRRSPPRTSPTAGCAPVIWGQCPTPAT